MKNRPGMAVFLYVARYWQQTSLLPLIHSSGRELFPPPFAHGHG